MKDLVSIIIMIYNNKSFLNEALDSVFMQEYDNIEIIISDDCSNNFDESDIDDITNYIEANKGDNVKNYLITKNKNNLGVIKNYNKCIVLSSGKYIMYLSGDDTFYDKTVVSDVVDFFENSDYLIATSYLNPIGPGRDSYPIKDFIRNNVDYLQGNPRDLYLRLSNDNFIAGANTYFKKELIEKYGLYDEDYILLEDWPRYLNLSRRGCPLGLIDRFTINYRLGGVTTYNTSTVSTPTQKTNIRNKISYDCDTFYKKEVFPYFELINNSVENFNDIALEEANKIENIKSSQTNLICYVIDDSLVYSFTKDKKVSKPIYPFSKRIREYIDLSSFENIYKLRIDPINSRCIIKINSIKMLKDNISTDLDIYYTNSYLNHGNIYFFGDDNPQIILESTPSNIDSIYIDYEFISIGSIFIP
ncbi:MAG: glycosyltransferase [Romboutsia sp.]